MRLRYSGPMSRPYRDMAELWTQDVDERARFILEPGSVHLLGISYPGAADPVPVTMTPGYEYRLRQIHHDETDVWVMERRSV